MTGRRTPVILARINFDALVIYPPADEIGDDCMGGLVVRTRYAHFDP
jgi:hypothetical protein